MAIEDQRVYKCLQTTRQLKVQRNADVLYLDDIAIHIESKAHREVLWLILCSPKNAVTHEAITRASGKEQTDEPKQVATKIIFEMRAALKVHKIENLIKTVWNSGYIVNGTCWAPVERAPTAQTEIAAQFLEALEGVVHGSVEHAKSCKIVHASNGLMWLDFDITTAIQRYQVVDTMLWDTIWALSSIATPASLMALKEDFHDLASYILCWRLGDSLSEEKWRSDYTEEIRAKANRIKAQVRHIQEATQRN